MKILQLPVKFPSFYDFVDYILGRNQPLLEALIASRKPKFPFYMQLENLYFKVVDKKSVQAVAIEKHFYGIRNYEGPVAAFYYNLIISGEAELSGFVEIPEETYNSVYCEVFNKLNGIYINNKID